MFFLCLQLSFNSQNYSLIYAIFYYIPLFHGGKNYVITIKIDAIWNLQVIVITVNFYNNSEMKNQGFQRLQIYVYKNSLINIQHRSVLMAISLNIILTTTTTCISNFIDYKIPTSFKRSVRNPNWQLSIKDGVNKRKI